MKVLCIEEIDGIKVVRGVRQRRLDPMQSGRQAKDAAIKLGEYKALTAAGKLARDAYRRLTAAVGKANKSKSAEDIEKATAVEKEFKEAKRQLKNAEKDFGAKSRELAKTEFVYFPLKENEKVSNQVDADRIERLLRSLKPGELLTLEGGDKVRDNRGAKFFTDDHDRLKLTTVVALGETLPPGAVPVGEASPEMLQRYADQLEAERVAGLSPEDCAQEFERAKLGLLNNAAAIRSRLEIQGTNAADALARAQSEYQGMEKQLKEKYGV